MLFALSILSQVIRFLYFEEEVRAIVIKDISSALNDGLTVLVEPGLDKVVLSREDVQGTIDIVQLKGRLLKEDGGLLVRNKFGPRIKDPGVDEP